MVQRVHREFSPPSRLLRRRRSLSPTYIELMRPVSELIRARSRPPEESERRSPTPERTRPRSPSPVSSERSLSRFERMARFDIFSRYESMKSALKTQKTMERKYEVLTQQPFTLDHAPRITLRMRSHRVPCGHSTRFILNVQSKPTAEVKWYHNGIELQESSKIHFTNTSGVLTLEILDCHIDDSGTYRAVCTNYKGECSDYATLDVTGGDYTTYSSQRRDEEVPRSILPDLTKTEAYAISSFKKASATEASSSVREVKSEMSATRESLLSYDHYASSEEKITAAEKKSLEERTVHKAFKSTLPATILTKPRSITVSEGETARFSCDVDGEPAPTITWIRAGQPIVSSRRFQVTRTQYKSTFEISSVQMSDEGSYTVVVENSEGRQEAHFTLTIQRMKIPEKAITSPPKVKSPEPRVKSPEPVKSPKRVKSPEPISSPPKAKSPPADKTVPAEKVQLPTASPPKIKQHLKAETFGDKVKLSCAVESSVLSVREVAWYKDGKKLKEDHHFKFHYAADGTYELKIQELKESDKGEYTCEIIGEGGVSKTNFQFTGQVFKNIHSQVKGVSETHKSVQKEDEVLTVSTQKKSAVATEEKAAVQEVIKKSIVTEDVKQLKAEIKASSTKMTVSEGQKVTLKANIPGASEVKWVLNGMELRNSDDYRYGVAGSDHTLTIKKASNEDEGILTCEGRTDEGIIKCQYVLTFSKERSNEPAFIMQPKSQNVNEGQDVLFTCEVSGDPSPEIE
ncbi:Titin, partial [Mesitornis unicolor]